MTGVSSLTLATVTGVQTFAAGAYPQEDGTVQEYAEADLSQVALNFRRLSTGSNPLHRVPVVRGHDDWHAGILSTATPADGWVTDCQAQGGLLVTNWGEVVPDVAEAIAGKKFRKVSAEIYEDFKDNQGRSYGRALRRVVLLGAWPPRVKGLADVPVPRFAEGPVRHAERVFSFGEVRPMSRDELLVALSKDGKHQRADLDKLTDDQLKALLAQGGASHPAPAPAAGATGAATPPAPAPVHPSPQPIAVPAPPGAAQTVQQFAELSAKLEARLAQIDAQIQASERQAKARAAAEQKALVYAECKRLAAAGKVEPWELDESNPAVMSLPQRLLNADATRIVRTFAEGTTTVQRTALDEELAALEARPVRRFAEQAIAGKAGTPEKTPEERAAEYAAKRNKQMAGRN